MTSRTTKQAPGDTKQTRVRSFVSPIVPRIMVASAIGLVVNWAVQCYLAPDAMRPLLPILGVVFVAILTLSYAVRRAASAGLVNHVGFFGILYVAVFVICLTLITYQLGNGVRYALSYSALLACVASFFWPRTSHFLIGTLVALTPPFVLILVAEDDPDIRLTGALFAFNSILLSAGTFWIVRQANDRIARLTNEITFQAEHDGLTGLMNRTSWTTAAMQQLAACARSGGTASVMMIDLDHFKQINDEQGHDAGDRFLVTVAGILQRLLPAGSLVGRLGGDEFVVFLPRVPLPEAERLASGLHHDLHALAHDEPALTMSIGLAEWDREQTLQELIAQADQAMFSAKRGGRDTTRSGALRVRPVKVSHAQASTREGVPSDARLEPNGSA